MSTRSDTPVEVSELSVDLGGDNRWRGWPANCRNFRPGLQDPLTMLELLEAAECRDLDRHAEQKVLHISEYGPDGTNLTDRYVSEEELLKYFAEYDHRVRERKGRFRLFFACADRGWDAASRPWMRRWWSHYSVPMDVAFAFASQPTMGFRVFSETIALPNKSTTGILHLWLRCHLNFEPLVGSRLNYYTDPVRRRHDINASTSSTLSTVFYEPAIYVQYDVETGESILLTLDHSPAYSALRRVCRHAAETDIERDPFVFLVSHLNCLLSSIQAACARWMTALNLYEAAAFEDNIDYSSHLKGLSRTRRAHQHSSRALDVMRQNVLQIREEHRKFAEANRLSLSPDLFNLVDDSLQYLELNVNSLAQEVRSYEDAVAGNIEILLGLSQLQNGIRMRIMTEDNQIQAVAAQAIARDTKRDSEVMKTITVVTLLYLPATFVCTLLSMGIFEWPSAGEAGGVRVTKTWWIFLAIAAPLSIVTCSLAFAWLWYTGRDTKDQKESEESNAQVSCGDKIKERSERPRGKQNLANSMPEFGAFIPRRRTARGSKPFIPDTPDVANQGQYPLSA